MAAPINERQFFGFRRTAGDSSRVNDNSRGVPALLVPTTDRDMHFASAADQGTDWNVANPANATLYLHAETTPATNYGTIAHNATDFVFTPNAGSVHIPSGGLGIADDVSLELGSTDDFVLRHRTATLAANTALTDVLIGTPVSQALAADSAVVSNVTASGDMAMYVNTGTNSGQFLFADASASILYFGQTGWAVNVLEGAVKLTLGTVSAFATTQPTNCLVMRAGTAPVGAITTAGGLFSSTTVVQKIIAAGTVSNVET